MRVLAPTAPAAKAPLEVKTSRPPSGPHGNTIGFLIPWSVGDVVLERGLKVGTAVQSKQLRHLIGIIHEIIKLRRARLHV